MDAAASRHVSLSQPHERETGLRIPSGLVSREEGFLCAFDVSFQQPDPSELAQRPPELASQVGAQLFARQKSLLLCLVARSPQPEDLGAVDATAPVDASDGTGRAPSLHGFRPFLGEIVLRDPLQGAHELAVDDPRGERIELARDRGDACFVEEHQALLDLARQDEASRLRDASNRGSGRVTLRTDLDRPPGPLAGLLQVADQQSLVAANHGHPARGRASRPDPRAGARRA